MRVVHRRIAALALALTLAACGDDSAEASRADAMTGTADAAIVAPDAQAEDASAAPADAALAFDAGSSDAYVPPQVRFPSEPPAQPFLLSSVGLYTDIATKALAPDLIAYEPAHALWSDGADKLRYLRLPPEGQVDNTDPDHWQFPVGAMLFKEFRTPDARLETRVIARTGSGERDYFFGAFVWRADESDAELAWDGASDVRGSAHDVPNTTQCGTCHNGEAGRVLGVSAIQTPALALPLTVKRAAFVIPGDAAQQRALGYLHANCGHCHNPSGSARPDTDLMLRLSVTQASLESTAIYTSTVGIRLQSFMGSDLKLRITAGLPEQSGLYFRMSQRGPRTQMPPIASEMADSQGLATVAAFIAALPH